MTKKNMLHKTILAILLSATVFLLAACSGTGSTSSDSDSTAEEESEITASKTSSNASGSTSTGTLVDTDDLFTDRDLEQEADLTDAISYTLTNGEDITITEEGVYLLQGSAEDVTVYVEAEDSDKVQIVLDGVSITNTDVPCIYVISADKVFVTTQSDSTLTVSGIITEDEENADAVIFSCDDLVLNGTATLTISSSDVGVDSKDDLKITGGTYEITAESKAFEANDSIRIADGTFILATGTDGFHAENTDDDSLGYIYIADGTFTIDAGDDGIHGTSFIQIDGGDFTISAVEAIEATYVQINGGTFNIEASDDGINASQKSTAYSPTIEITGGEFEINMASGDTDALDSNGNLLISGGTLNINATSAFDYDGTGSYTGGTLIVNGETVTELTQSMMGGGGGNMAPGGGMGSEGQNPPDMESDGTMPEMPGSDMQPSGNSNGMRPSRN